MVTMFAEARPVEPRTDATIATAAKATRAVTRSHRCWSRVRADVTMLPSSAACPLSDSETVREDNAVTYRLDVIEDRQRRG